MLKAWHMVELLLTSQVLCTEPGLLPGGLFRVSRNKTLEPSDYRSIPVFHTTTAGLLSLFFLFILRKHAMFLFKTWSVRDCQNRIVGTTKLPKASKQEVKAN